MDMDILNFIADLPLCHGLDPAAVQSLAAGLTIQELPGGAELLCQDDRSDAFYIVASGEICLQLTQTGDCSVATQPLTHGQCFGEISLLAGQSCSVAVFANLPTRLLCLSRPAFDHLAEAYPGLASRLAAALLERFQLLQAYLILTRLFGSLDQALLSDLQAQIEWRRLTSGEVLFRQDDPGDEMYLVAQGRLRFAVEEGAGARDLGEVGAGESIGEFALLAERGSPESRRSATVYAIRATDLIVITRAVFEGLLCQYPQALLKLTHRIIRRQLRLGQQVSSRLGAMVICLLPVHPTQSLDEFARQLSDSLNGLGASQTLDAAHFERLFGKPGAAQTPLDHPASPVINAWLDERERQLQYVIYNVQPVLDPGGRLTPWAQRCLEDADVILLIGEEGADPAPAAIEAALPTARTRARLELALIHPAACQFPSGTSAWLSPRRSGDFPVKAHYHARQGNAADFRRLARRLAGCPLGLALGGGGARGWAHLGVIRALEERGLEVDWVGGASMGAIMAAGYALDWSTERLRQFAESFSDPKKLLDYTFPYASITTTRRITELLRGLIGDLDIEDTWRPFYCVSSNLTRGEEQLHLDGRLWKAVRASMAFPGVFAPVSDGGCLLIDGGAANNVPVDRMREQCPTGTVIGVHLVTNSPVSGPYDFSPHLSGWRSLLGRLNPFSQSAKIPNLLDILNGLVYSITRYRLNEVGECADLLIRIPVEAFGLLEFDQYAQIIELGYVTAKEQLAVYSQQATARSLKPTADSQ